MGKFRDAMLRDLLLRELAPTTINAYLRGAREWVAHYMRPPDELTREDVCAYLDHLRKRGLSPSSRAVYLSGIRFLYAVTLERPEVVAFLRRPKVPLKNVRVLKGQEIRQLMDALPLIQHRALFAVSYGCGLRVSEACQLRIEDIDSERERILVREAKGGKDRYVPLGPTVLRCATTTSSGAPPGPTCSRAAVVGARTSQSSRGLSIAPSRRSPIAWASSRG